MVMPCSFTPADDEALRRLERAGFNTKRMAALLGKKYTTVRRRLIALNLRPAAPTDVKQAEKERVLTQRACLRCHKPFQSEGSHNRMCAPCKRGSIWRAGGDFSMRI